MLKRHRTSLRSLILSVASLLAIAGAELIVFADEEPKEIAVALQEAADLENENHYVALYKVTKHLEDGRPLPAEQLRQYFEICGKMINAGGGSPKQAAISLGRVAKQYPEPVKALIPSLVAAAKRDRRQDERCEISIALRNCGPPAQEALPWLKEQMNSEEVFSRLHATIAVGCISKADVEMARRVLQESLKDSRKHVRWIAAMGFGYFGNDAKPDIPLLTDCLNDSNWNVRVMAASSLWKITGSAEKLLPVLIEALDHEEAFYTTPFSTGMWLPSTDMMAVSTLRQMGDAARPSVPALLKAAKREDVGLRHSIHRALETISPEDAPAVLELYRELLKKNHLGKPD